jgi:metallophosphoesterase superfamily enzyme
MGNDERIVRQLDHITFLLSLAFRDQISAAQQDVLTDPVAAAVLEAVAEDWVAAGDLKRQVAASTKQSERSVSRRLTQLVADGWIELSGAGANVKYRSRGIG